jgi:hypothetical protein
VPKDIREIFQMMRCDEHSPSQQTHRFREMTVAPLWVQRVGQSVVFNRVLTAPSSKLRKFLLGSCFVLLGPLGRAFAQPAFVFPSSVSIGGLALSEAATVTIQSPGTLFSVQVVTQGVTNLDFTASGTNTCISGSYVQGQTCTVSVSFAPKYPGLRLGAIVLVADDGHVMATQYLSAVGTGALSVMVPGQISTLAGDGCLSDGFCTTVSPVIFLTPGSFRFVCNLRNEIVSDLLLRSRVGA